MHYHYIHNKTTATGLYRHLSRQAPPVVVTRDSTGHLVAFCADREAVNYFADQQHGIIVGGYSLVAPDRYYE